jgi:hypothetical protein
MRTLFQHLFLVAVAMQFAACSAGTRKTGGTSTTNSGGAAVNFSKVVSSRELLSYLNVALNYNTGGNSTLITEFNNLYPTLPQNGDSAFSGSASRMYTNFVYRVCLASKNNELNLPASSRVVFKFVDLAGAPNTVSGNDREQQMNAFIRHIAYRFYNSEIPDDEFAEIRNFYLAQRSAVTQDAAGAQDLAVQVCALVGSTPRDLMKM